MAQEIVMYDNPDIVERVENISGWVGKDGRFYGNDEHLARHANCTHKKCDCGGIMTKYWMKCENCRASDSKEKYKALEPMEWDGKCLISWDDRYLSDFDDLIDYAIGYGGVESLHDLHLYPTKKEYNFSVIDEELLDSLNEDYCTDSESFIDLHPEIMEAVKELNAQLRNTECKIWFPINYRLVVPDEVEQRFQKELKNQ